MKSNTIKDATLRENISNGKETAYGLVGSIRRNKEIQSTETICEYNTSGESRMHGNMHVPFWDGIFAGICWDLSLIETYAATWHTLLGLLRRKQLDIKEGEGKACI